MASTSGADWMQNLDSMQRQYWEQWSALTRQVLDAQDGQQPLPSWHRALEHWSSLYAPGSGAQNDLAERVLEQSKQFFKLFDQALRVSAGQREPAAVQDWLQALRNALGAGTDPARPVLDALATLQGEGARGFDALVGEALRAGSALGGEWKDLLRIPAFGYTRERQEEAQALTAAVLDYQERLAEYQRLLNQVGQGALARFESKLAERSEPGRRIESLRALYDLWIDAAEEAYAEVALGAEFRRVYGALVNAQMQVQQRVQKMVERQTGALGMPTRSELNAVHKRLKELRRERGAGAAATPDPAMAELQREVAALRAELDALKQSTARAGRPATGAVPSVESRRTRAPAARTAPGRSRARKA